MANLHKDLWRIQHFLHAQEKEMGLIRSFRRAARIEKTQPKQSRPAQREADKIKATKDKMVEQIKGRQAKTRQQQAQDINAAWDTYREQKAGIYANYDALLK